jgi:predicted acetyltransferase
MSPPTHIDVRTATEEDWPLIRALDERAFGFSSTSERTKERATFEFDRTVLASVAGPTVGLGSIYSMEMSVPGGALVPMAGVTWVGVQATHRRRGVLTAMMRRMVDDTRDRGTEAVMGLFALDPGIYGRFGFDIATRALSVTLPTQRGHLAWAGDAEPGLTVRMADPADERDALETVARRVAGHRAGGLVRSPGFWDLHLEDSPEDRGGGSARRAFIVDDADGPRAYAQFRTKIGFDQPVPTGELIVRELGYVDPHAAALLWRTLIGHDLVSTVSAWNLPVDDPLLFLLGDPRSPKPVLKDGLHVRIVDVPRALEARAYAVPVDVVFDLVDPFAPWCTGRYRLSAGTEGASCAPTRAAPDLALGAAELSAVYLGGTRLSVLADAGRVRELTPGAVASTSRALTADRQPWCPFIF